SGSYSIRLELPTPIENLDEARVKFGYDDTLNSLTGISFYARLEVSFPSGEGFYTPYITMSMDRDGDTVADAWLVSGPLYYSFAIFLKRYSAWVSTNRRRHHQ
ncbi:unnamed protein product, partial [marine sediment metagenome]